MQNNKKRKVKKNANPKITKDLPGKATAIYTPNPSRKSINSLGLTESQKNTTLPK